MKNDNQTMLFVALLVTAGWLLFFRSPKTEKFCGGCGGLVA